MKFIWSGKNPKIKWDILISRKEDGGAGLVNMEAKNWSLKLGWLVQNLENQEIQNLAREALGIKGNLQIWQSNLNSKDVANFFSVDNYWKEILTYWTEQMYHLPETSGEVKQQSIWMNCNIRIEDKPVYYVYWSRAGINKIVDLLQDNGKTFKMLQEIKDKYGIELSFLDYASMKTAIPKSR